MNKKVRNGLIIAGCSLAVVGIIAGGPISRLVYTIYDTVRTNDIIKELEAKKNSGGGGGEEEADVNRRAFFNLGSDGRSYDLLVLVDDANYELLHYAGTAEATTAYYMVKGDYTEKDNVVTLTDITDDVSCMGINLTSGDNATTRKTMYESVYSATTFGLQKDGTFKVGGTSDTTEAIVPGCSVYYGEDNSSRPTYKTAVLFTDGSYIISCFALNSKNHEECSGSFAGKGEYEITKADVVSNESAPDQKYSVVNFKPGYGYQYANNNGSLMEFDSIKASTFTQWYTMSLSGTTTAEARISVSGYSYKAGAKTESFGKYSLSFVDTSAADPDTPEEEDKSVFPITMEVATSGGQKPFQLIMNEDGTMTTGWPQYTTTVKTCAWSVEDGELVFDMGDSGYTASAEKQADGTAKITVNYGQMGEKVYTMTAEQYAAVVSGNVLFSAELATSGGQKPFTVTINKDGTMVTGWPQYESTVKTVAWDVNAGNVVFDMGDSGYTAEISQKEDGSYVLTATYGQMGTKEYPMTAAQYNAILAARTVYSAELETSNGQKPFTVAMYQDGSMVTGWPQYATTVKSAKWDVTVGNIVFDMGETGYTAAISQKEDGSYVLTATYGQMGTKEYAMTAAQYNAILATRTVYSAELETSNGQKPFTIAMYQDGSMVTGWPQYATTVKSAKWDVTAGNIVFDMGDTGYTAEISQKEDGSYVLTATYGQMGTKEYAMTAAQYNAIVATRVVYSAELETSNGQKPFTVAMYKDGSMVTGWPQYATTVKTCAWSVKDGKIVFDMGETGYTAAISQKEDGSYVLTATYGQMGTKEYAMTAAQYNALLNC